jgi:hypothetical protein
MALSKTERGQAVLQGHAAAGLSLAERRVLILCDGRRRRDDVVALLGTHALSLLERLLREGYLTVDGGVPPAPRPLATASGAASTRGPVAAPALSPSAPPPASRRSLAVSRMYLIDMLQLQRDPESASLRAEIQTSPSEEELVYRMMKGLRHLQAVAAGSYARRVGDRLAEILPEQHLPRLDLVRAGWFESASAVA